MPCRICALIGPPKEVYASMTMPTLWLLWETSRLAEMLGW